MSARIQERRSAERVPCRVLVHHVQGNELHLFQMIEISETGCLLRARSAGCPTPGTRIRLPVQLPGAAGEIDLTGVVVGDVDERGDVFAIALGEVAAATATALRTFVADSRYVAVSREAVAWNPRHAARTA